MKKATPQAIKLYNALKQRNIKSELEKWDKHKHIDIAITWARLNIEIDGLHHYTNPSQIIRDFSRSDFSTIGGYNTIHIPNELIDQYVNEIADAIAKVCRMRYEDLNQDTDYSDEF